MIYEENTQNLNGLDKKPINYHKREISFQPTILDIQRYGVVKTPYLTCDIGSEAPDKSDHKNDDR